MLNFEVLFQNDMFIHVYVHRNTNTLAEDPMPKYIEIHMPAIPQLFEVLNTTESSILNVMGRKIECTHLKSR